MRQAAWRARKTLQSPVMDVRLRHGVVEGTRSIAARFTARSRARRRLARSIRDRSARFWRGWTRRGGDVCPRCSGGLSPRGRRGSTVPHRNDGARSSRPTVLLARPSGRPVADRLNAAWKGGATPHAPAPAAQPAPRRGRSLPRPVCHWWRRCPAQMGGLHLSMRHLDCRMLGAGGTAGRAPQAGHCHQYNAYCRSAMRRSNTAGAAPNTVSVEKGRKCLSLLVLRA